MDVHGTRSILRLVATSLIMIVDDDADIRRILAEALRDAGHETLEARNGHDALEQLRMHNRPCTMLLDLWMPVIDGWGVLEQLRSDASLPRVRVIAMSAAPLPEEVGLTVLRKPFDLDELLVLLR